MSQARSEGVPQGLGGLGDCAAPSPIFLTGSESPPRSVGTHGRPRRWGRAGLDPGLLVARLQVGAPQALLLLRRRVYEH